MQLPRNTQFQHKDANSNAVLGLYRFLCFVLCATLASSCTTLDGIERIKTATTTYSNTSRNDALLTDSPLQTISFNEWQQELGTQDVHELTDLIDAPVLAAYIHAAMQHNPNIQQTKLALEIAYKNQGVVGAGSLPNVSAGVDASKARANGRIGNTSYSGKLRASWEPDVWGKLQRRNFSAETNRLSTEMRLQAATDALAANMMRQYLDIIQQQQLLHIEQKRLRELKDIQTIVTQRFRLGLTDLTSLSNARKNVQQASARLPEYQHNLYTSKRAFEQLMGVLSPNATEVLPLLKNISNYPKIRLPLARIKVQDLRMRPDLQQAYFDIRSKEIDTDVAYRELLPSINLSATLSQTARQPLKLFDGSPAWNLLGQLSAPIFDGQRLKGQAEITDLQAAKAYWAFKQQLVSAYTSVKNALANETALVARQRAISAALKQATLQNENIQTQYRRGSINLDTWLNAKQQQYDLEAQLSRLHYAHLVNRVTIGSELGLGIHDRRTEDARNSAKVIENSSGSRIEATQ